MHDCDDSVVALSGPFVIDAYFTAISLARPRGLHEAGPPACTFRAAPLGLIAVWLQSCERFAAAVTVKGIGWVHSKASRLPCERRKTRDGDTLRAEIRKNEKPATETGA
jgi:hypothetical protein